MTGMKLDRALELFFRAMQGESLSVRRLADQYQVSTRSISRDITGLKLFLADHRDLVGNAELVYSHKERSYHLYMDEFVSNKELFAIIKILFGCRPFETPELLHLIAKLKARVTVEDRKKLEPLIRKEIYHYQKIHSDCANILDNMWELTEHIEEKRAITVRYNRKDGSQVQRELLPLSIMFSEYYFYLIAYEAEDQSFTPKHFRIDRILSITAHRKKFKLPRNMEFDEGYLRNRGQFMWPGRLQTVRFTFSGPSVQAILDRLPTAKVIDMQNGIPVIEAEVFGDGIRMFLLSQGSWVKVLAPEDFVQEMREEVRKLSAYYPE